MKWVLVTGSTGTIGSAICDILSQEGYSIILAGRDQNKLNALKKRLEHKYKNQYEIFFADLRSKSEILKAIHNTFNNNSIKLYGLINNASETPRKKIITEEGLECQFSVNILGYHRMIAYLLDFFEVGARIVNVASYWAGELNIEDLQFQHRHYDNNTAYRQSKQAERMLTVAWAEQLKNRNITVNSCHPGDANSKLSNDLGFGGFESPHQAAATPAYLIYSKEVENITGKYFENQKETFDPFSSDKIKIQKLFEICNQYL